MRTRPVALAGLALAALVLSGCSAAPAVDQEAAQNWMKGAQSDLEGRTGLLGTTSGVTSRTQEGGITLAFEIPVDVTGFEVSCFGGGSAEFGYSLTGDGVGSAAESTVECTEDPVLVEVGLDGADRVAGVSSLLTRVSRADSDTTFVVAVVGTES